MLTEEAPMEGDEYAGTEQEEIDWLSIAKEAYKTSTDYLDANYRKQWEKNVSNFQSRHPSGSKYYTDAYKFRSRMFRPKTRSAIKRSEAQFAAAMFATSDVITVDPVDQMDAEEDKQAEVWQAVLNYRLRHSVPWFLTCVGAFQESKIYGIVVSRQEWLYEEIQEEQVSTDPITQAEVRTPVKKVIEDRPVCELIEIENIRFDPAAKWYDPVGTSPYFIELMPMYVGDVLEMMKKQDPKTGRPAWKEYDRGEVLAYGQRVMGKSDTTGQAREGNKTDPKGNEQKAREFEIVWVHRNFVKKDGTDYEFYTLTDMAMLTDPVPSTSPLGRPYRVGISAIEAHRAIPAGDAELGAGLQAEANEIVNQRLDNVKIVLNRGKYAKRNSGTDLATLKRSYPGRIVMTDDPGSIKEEIVQDVTGSAYQEQDRVNADMDDLLGGFAGGSVMSNRALNETVGGMNLINQSGNSVAEYGARTFVETWVEPVLSDLIKLIQLYESDEILQRFAKTASVQIGDRKQFMKRMSVAVSVGFGSLDPKARTQTVTQVLMALGKMAPWAMAGLDVKRLSKEMFGTVGYRDGSKFFSNLPDGPPQQPEDPMIGLKKQELEMKSQIEMARIKADYDVEMSKLAMQYNMTQDQLYAKLDLDERKHNLDIMKEMSRREDIATKREEMALRLKTGEGI